MQQLQYTLNTATCGKQAIFQIWIEISHPRATTEADKQLVCPDKILANKVLGYHKHVKTLVIALTRSIVAVEQQMTKIAHIFVWL